MFFARTKTCQGKNSWPGLVTEHGHKTVAKIEGESPSVKAVIIDKNNLFVQNFNCNRVWVRVNSDGKVIATPKIG